MTRVQPRDQLLDPAAAADLVAEAAADLTFWCSPNNPTGEATGPEVLAAVCAAAPGLVVVDEAYGEFGTSHAAALLSRHPNLVVTRTFSKAFRMAGLRLGYLLADPAVVDGIRLVRLPYHLSALTQAVGLRALHHKGVLTSHVVATERERERVAAALDRLPGVGSCPATPTSSASRPRGTRAGCGGACSTAGSWSATCPLPDPGAPPPGHHRHAGRGRRLPDRPDRGAGAMSTQEPRRGPPGSSGAPPRSRSPSSSTSTAPATAGPTPGCRSSTTCSPSWAGTPASTCRVEAKGDLEIDAHHTVEDTGIAIGQALAEALGDKSGVRRFGDAVIPLDEARARAAVDLSGRPYLVWDVQVDAAPGELGSFDPRQARHFLEALVGNARCTVHVQLEAGDLPHHCLEACFKALARAFGDACAPDPRAGAGSTKGVLG